MIYKVPQQFGPMEGAFGLFVTLGFFAVLFLPRIFFLITMQKAMNRCPYGRRPINPGLVWLSMIPLVNVLWDFVVVGSVSTCVSNELRRRGVPPEMADAGLGFGLVFCLLAFFLWIPFVNILVGVASLVFFIIYWVRIARASKMLSTTPEPPADTPAGA